VTDFDDIFKQDTTLEIRTTISLCVHVFVVANAYACEIFRIYIRLFFRNARMTHTL